MAFLDLTRRVSECIIERVPASKREDVDLVHELAFMRAACDAVPAPPMRGDLLDLIGADGAGPSEN
jgi:hypothetical protein